jgi:uridylate kinase
MEKGRVVIFAAGLGAPYFTTDSSAVQRALEMQAGILVMAKNGVDGLYTGNPHTDPAARKITTISASEVLTKNLKAADQSAIALAKEHGLVIKVIGLADLQHALDPSIGSTIEPDLSN